MELDFRRKETPLGIVIITGSCCIPGMAPLEERARRVVEQAISETGVATQVRLMPATTAYMGGAPKEVIAQLVGRYNQSGQIGLPVILVNGKAVSFGLPEVEQIKTALFRSAGVTTAQENKNG